MTVNLTYDATRVYLDAVDAYQVCDPMYEGVRVVLAARGEGISPAMVQGLSGGAFRIAGICPCAPTCGVAMPISTIIELLGYEQRHLPLSGTDEVETSAVIAAVRAEIDAGQTALVFHAFTMAEWDIVCGYDSAKATFLGRGSYAGNNGTLAEAPWDRMAKCGEICPPDGVILIGIRTRIPDIHTLALAAVREAVRHGRAPLLPREDGRWTMAEGIACYDRWAISFENPEKRRDSGDAYCYGVFRSRRHQAPAFLREILPQFTDAAVPLEAAASAFAREVDYLDNGESLLWWNSPDDGSRNSEAASILRQARDAYAAGIEALEDVLAVYPT